jgi:RimJ/RimL family protein N-acetyltransferase
MVILETERLVLRRLTPADLDDLHQMLGDPEVMKFYPSVKTRDESQVWLNRILEHYEKNGVAFWGALLKTSGDLVGQIGLLQHRIPEVPELEIGYLLKRRFWHRGFAREGAAACRDFAFGALDQQRVVSMIDPRNQPSIRVAQSIGMSFERRCFVPKFEKEIAVYAVTRTPPSQTAGRVAGLRPALFA